VQFSAEDKKTSKTQKKRRKKGRWKMLKTFSHLPLTFPLCSILFCGCHIRFVFASLKTHCQMCHTEVIVRVVLFPCSFTVISPDTMRVPLFQSAEL